MSYLIPDPIGVEFEQWAHVVVEQLASLALETPVPGRPWQEWANSLLGSPVLSSYNVPMAAGFSSWREWACRFVESVR